METKTLGRYIVADPTHPAFRSTRIMVADALEQVESGMAGGERWSLSKISSGDKNLMNAQP